MSSHTFSYYILIKLKQEPENKSETYTIIVTVIV